MAMYGSGQQSYAFVIVLTVVFSVSCATSVISQGTTSVIVPVSASVISTPAASSPVASAITGTVSMTTRIASTPTSPPTIFKISIELIEETFTAELLNTSSKLFRKLRDELTAALKSSLNVPVTLVVFRPGSVIATFDITPMGDPSLVKEKLRNDVKDGNIGNFSVLPTLISLPDAFEVSLKIKEKCVDDYSNKSSDSYKSFASKVESNIKENSTMTTEIADVKVKSIECSKSKDFTTVLILVQVNSTTNQVPDQQLKDLKKDVKQGRVGSLQVVPDSWEAYKSGQIKKFVVSVKLTSNNVPEQDLQEAIEKVFSGGKSGYINSNVDINGTTATIDIDIVPRSSSNPNEALKQLKEAAGTGKIGSVGVESTSYKAWTTTPVNEKVFEVEFNFPMEECVHATLHDPIVTESVANYTKKMFRGDLYFNGVLPVELLECTPDAVQVRVQISMDPSVSDDPNVSLNKFVNFVSCKKKKNKGTSYKMTLLTFTKEGSSSKPVAEKCPTESPPTTTSPSLPTTSAPQKLPKLYVKLTLDMTWREFCNKNLEQKLKEKIAENVRNKNGQPISPDQVLFFNKEKRCNDPLKHDEQVDLWFYVSHAPGTKKPARCLTLQAFKKLKKFLDTDGTKNLGPDFDGKVVDVRLGGCDAYKFLDTSSPKLSGLAIIIIAVLAGVVTFLLLLLLWCCCWFICCRGRRRRRKRKEQELVVLGDVPVVFTDGEDGLDGKNKNKKKNKKDKGTDKKKKKKKAEQDSDDDGTGDKKDKTDQNGGGTGVVAYQNNAYNAGAADDDYAALSGDAQGKHDYATLEGNQKDGNANLSYDADGGASNGARSGPDGGIGTGTGTGSVTGNSSADGKATGTGSGVGGRSGGGLMAPVIVTSPIADSNSPSNSPSTPVSARRGSASLGDSEGRGSGSKPSSPLTPRHGSTDRGRRRSSAHSTDEEVDPLTHKTATVGIVALALRNKNERKKDTEFKNLNQEMPEEGTYPASTESKNRSPYILPEPKTRVKLSTSPDYINANLMRDHKGQIFYIATQHPLRDSIDDYWRMVWDQKSTILVMVNDEEKDKPEHFPSYLPNGEGSTKKFRSVDVTVKTITTTADYVITILAVGGGKPGATREVTHFHFTSWKGRGAVPNVGQFVAFVMATRKVAKKTEETKAPIIVNCNTGQGFSGVYIALDIGIRSHQESKTSVVDVFEVAKKLRHDRKGIIATRDHYNFIYQALYEYTVNYDEDEG